MRPFLVLILFSLAGSISWAEDVPIRLATPTGELSGTLCLPESSEQDAARNMTCPVVLLIGGSGQTDRDGNPSQKKSSDNPYRLLAEGLKEHGIASVRFDKRGVGESGNAVIAEKDFRVETYVADTVRWIDLLSKDERFSKVVVLGHSAGSLIGMLACAHTDKAKAFISVAGPGRNIDVLFREHLEDRLKKQDQVALNRILEELKNGRSVKADEVPESLTDLFRPGLQPYLISWIRYDPRLEIRQLKIPVLIVQGTKDTHVPTKDAELLSQAAPKAKKVLIQGMGHNMKEPPVKSGVKNGESERSSQNLLHKEMVPALADFISSL